MAFVGGLSGVFSLLGTVVGAVGAIAQGNAAAAAAEYNAKIAERNAKIAQQNASAEAEAQQRATSRRLATVRANVGASGITTQGTPLEVLSETASLGELDRLTILTNGQNNAFGFQADAQLERMRGRAARQTGFFNAAGTLLGGVGTALRTA